MAQGKDTPKKRRAEDDLLDWFTISYRSIYIVVGSGPGVGSGYRYFKSGPSRSSGIRPAVEATTSVPRRRASRLRRQRQGQDRGTLEWMNAIEAWC